MTKTKISKSEARFQAKRNDITAQAILQKKRPASKDVDWLDKDVVRYFEQFEQTWEVEEKVMANNINTSGRGYGIGTYNSPFDYVNLPNSSVSQWESELEALKRAIIQRGGKVIDEKEYERMKAKMVGMQEENRKLREELAAAKKQNKALEDALALINK